jgi:hypothetical protein
MNNWSDEEDCDTAFAASNVTVRTPVKPAIVPTNVENAPKKKENTLLMKLKGESMMNPNSLPIWESMIEALQNVQDTLSQDKIKSHQKAGAHERISWVIDQIRATTSAPSRQLTSTPPPPPPPASQPIIGTPIDQPNIVGSTAIGIQATSHRSPIQKAQDTLDVALKYLHESYQKVGGKIKKGEDPKTIVVDMPLSTLEEIGKKVSDAKHHLSHHSTHSEDIGERLSRLETTIKESLASTTKTWAQVVAATPEPDQVREIQQRNLQRKLERRYERTKLEVTLTTQEANLDTKEQLAKHTHSEITAKLQEVVQSQVKNNGPTIQGIQKLKSHDIRIHCNTAEEAEHLRKLKWNEAYAGLTVRQPKYGIMVNGVPMDLINSNRLHDSELARELECQNKASGIQVVGMKPLRRKLRADARDFSLVVFVTNPETADHCIKHGIYIGQRRFPVEKYAPQFQLVQCYKCQRFGHHAATCRSLHDICAKCSEHHATIQCKSEIHKCVGCNGEHPAWHQSCPKRIRATQDLATRKREAPVYFNE